MYQEEPCIVVFWGESRCTRSSLYGAVIGEGRSSRNSTV